MASDNYSRIAVLESKRFDRSNVSIRDQFDLIAEINYDTRNAYYYEMVNSEASAKEAIRKSLVR